ncbi:conserved unknown protein [Ectocarpus siliculosus]|uniref:Rubisco LSMT substrate-binding domain-containing protein n=1 Tax=Ectocarpus siliculosus TaxID=2880 RepID=D8LD79_ECTSI|nr:conserved unknown protein [Ectocarpus siliculosus]|eukprot:CBN75532.1 conserved unknown protein [Ectocarpus siliculosus]
MAQRHLYSAIRRGDAEGDGGRDATAVELDGLLSWFVEHGGSMTKLCLEDLGGEMSLSLLTGQALNKGEVVMSIPISLCMTVDSVLALHLMAERRKGDGSFWKQYLRTLPDDVDTPLRWLVEQAEEEFRLLDGTMVGLLSRMMHSQVRKDWEEFHLPLVEAHPEILGGVTFEDYLWAMSSIWSRSFDYQEPGPDDSPCSRRAMVPVINAANHDPSAADSLSEMIEFQAQEGGLSMGIGEPGRARGTLRVSAGRDYAAREQFFILYGRYSNAKLLYSYGFVLASNPYGGLDYWVRVPQTDPGFAWKQALLDEHPLTAAQAYDFSGTVRAGGWISPALLATVRVAQLTADERPVAEKAFEGKMVTPRNEAASLGALLAGLRRKLTTLGGTADERSPSGWEKEKQDIAALEGELERRQQRRQPHGGEGELAGGEEEGGDRGKEEERGDGGAGAAITAAAAASRCSASGAAAIKSLRRRVAAARVRLEEKAVVADAILALEASLRELQAAASSGVGAVASFETLDCRTG